MLQFRLLTPVVFCIFLASCESDTVDGRRAAPDVSHIKLDARIERFDQDLFAVDTNEHITKSINGLGAANSLSHTHLNIGNSSL